MSQQARNECGAWAERFPAWAVASWLRQHGLERGEEGITLTQLRAPPDIPRNFLTILADGAPPWSDYVEIRKLSYERSGNTDMRRERILSKIERTGRE